MNEDINITQGQYNKHGIRYTYVFYKDLIITFIANYPKDSCECNVSLFNNGFPIFRNKCEAFDEAEPVITKELIKQLINLGGQDE